MPNPILGGHRMPSLPTALPKAQPPMPVMPVRRLTMPPLPPTPVAMPPLPATPSRPGWTAARNPSARIVQQHYVDMRLEQLDAARSPGRRAALVVLEAFLRQNMPPQEAQREIPPLELVRILNEIERNLMSAELTINFEPTGWFMTENPYDTYTQMYERSMKPGEMILRGNDKNPDADLRANVDNQMTFPEKWSGGQAGPRRGLAPGKPSASRIQAQMDTGPMVKVAADSHDWRSTNPHFNPRTKQIFFGLNYMRRPHGSAPNFGWSHLVISNKLKQRCIYFAGDTFLYAGSTAHAATTQVRHDNLGTILAQKFAGSDVFRERVIRSCYRGEHISIFGLELCKFELLEAHHFGELSFREHVKRMILSPRRYFSMHGKTDSAEWQTIVTNARKFCERHDIKLFQTD